MTLRSFTATAAAALLAAGCSSSSSKSDAGAPNVNCGGATKACLTGVVTTAATVDLASPAGVSGATVTLADGTFLGTANEQGWYFVRNVPAGASVPVCFEAANYTRRCRNITAGNGQNVQVSNTGLLDRAAFTGSIDPAVGGSVTVGVGTQLWFPAGGACRATGAAATSPVSCALTPIVAADEVQLGAAPGAFRGQQTGGTTSQLVTGGMMEIVCKDGSGAKVNVCAGSTVNVRFPVDFATCANAALHPDTMKSWGYDEAAGVWKEYGTFAKTCGTSTADSYYEGLVNHFSYWNADNPIQTSCATGHVLDNAGAPVLGALVRCDGDAAQADGYQGPSEAYSDAAGGFCVPVRRNSAFRCVARKGAFVSLPISGHSADNQLTCGGPGCTALGNFTLTDPLARIVLTWGATPSDLDSHLVGADYATGTNVWYSDMGSLASAPFVELDTDDTSGYGPEVVSFVHGATAQRYRYCVDRYSSGDLSASGAVVDAFLNGGHVRVEVPPGAGTNRLWRVLEFVMDANGNVGGVRVLNTFAAASGSNDPATCMQ